MKPSRLPRCAYHGCRNSSLPDDRFCKRHQKRMNDPRDPRRRPTSEVYFALAAAVNVIKIGTSVRSADRIRNLSTTSPTALTLIGTIHGAYNVERWCHHRCIAERSHCEWFHWNERTEAFVRLVLAHGVSAAETMCPKHLRADLLIAAGRNPRSGQLDPLPYNDTLPEYLESTRRASQIGECECALCAAYVGGAP